MPSSLQWDPISKDFYEIMAFILQSTATFKSFAKLKCRDEGITNKKLVIHSLEKKNVLYQKASEDPTWHQYFKEMLGLIQRIFSQRECLQCVEEYNEKICNIYIK